MTPEPHSRSSTEGAGDPEEALTANGGLFRYQPPSLLGLDESLDAGMSDVSGEGDMLSSLSDREADVVSPPGPGLEFAADGAVLDRLDATGESVVAIQQQSSQQFSGERTLPIEHAQNDLSSTEHAQKGEVDVKGVAGLLFTEHAQEGTGGGGLDANGTLDTESALCSPQKTVYSAVLSSEHQDMVLPCPIAVVYSSSADEAALQGDGGPETSSPSRHVAMDTERVQVTTNQDLLSPQSEVLVDPERDIMDSVGNSQTEHAQVIIAEQHPMDTEHLQTLSTEKSPLLTEHAQNLGTEETDWRMAYCRVPPVVDDPAISSLEPRDDQSVLSSKSASSIISAELSGTVETARVLVTAETGERRTPPSSADTQIDLTEHGT